MSSFAFAVTVIIEPVTCCSSASLVGFILRRQTVEVPSENLVAATTVTPIEGGGLRNRPPESAAREDIVYSNREGGREFRKIISRFRR